MKKIDFGFCVLSIALNSSAFANCPDTNVIGFDVSGAEINFSFPDSYDFGSFITQTPNQNPDQKSRIRFSSVEFLSDETSDTWEKNEISHFARVIPGTIGFTCKYEIGFKNYLSIVAKPDIFGRFFKLTDFYDHYDAKANVRWVREGDEAPYHIQCVIQPISYAHTLRKCQFEEVDTAMLR